MEEVVKEELSRAACQLSPQTPAAGSCHGDGPLCWTASVVALHRDVEAEEGGDGRIRLRGWKRGPLEVSGTSFLAWSGPGWEGPI